MARETTDVVVIGSGAGGGPVALVLARAGLRVVVLEKGRAIPPEELTHDEVRMSRRDFFVPHLTNEPHTIRASEEKEAERTREGWTANIVGGGTAHYSGFFFRMKPSDMKLRSILGAVPGSTLTNWPVAYEELEPYFATAERELGVSGVWKRHPFEEPRTADYPLPPLPEHIFASKIDEVGKRLGLHPFPTPRAILSQPRGDRGACVPCGMCGSFGCPSGAKGSTAVSFLAAAQATSKCEVRPQCMVMEIAIDSAGRASEVVYRDGKGQTNSIGARCVVLAASAIESARLLLLSRSGRFPNGLANQNGQVGRNLVFSGLAKGMATFRLEGRGWLQNPGSPFVQRSLQDYYLLEKPVDGMRKAGTLLFTLAHPAPIGIAEKLAVESSTETLWGKALKDRVRGMRGLVRLEFESFGEYLPSSGTYVDLDPQIKDKWKLPVARITVQPHPLDRKSIDFLRERGLEFLRAMEADDVAVDIMRGETKFLQCGTCRMGNDPETSVTNRDGRTHDVPNLFVSDGGVLPTSGGVPPTLTIMANAFRIGERVAAHIKDGKI